MIGMAVYTAGNMIGTGTHQTLIKLAGDGCDNALWANFLLAGLLASLSAVPLLHLYDKFPNSDCLHQAASEGLGGFWGPLVSFVNGQLITIELVFAVTMQTSFFGDCVADLLAEDLAGRTPVLVCLGLLFVLFLVYRISGALFTANVAWFLGVVELVTVGLLVLSGPLRLLAGGPLRPTVALLDWSRTRPASFLSGIHVAIFAYGGFPGMLQEGGLVKNPRRNLPLGILVACAMTMCIYSLMSASVLLVAEPGDIAGFTNGFDALRGTLSAPAIAVISCTVLSSVANNIMENTLVVIENVHQMTTAKDDCRKLVLAGVDFCSPDVLVYGAIAVLTAVKKDIGLGALLGDAIDFALILQFGIFAVLSLANLDGQQPLNYRSLVPVVSLAANGLLGVWHLYNASATPMVILMCLVLLPLVFSVKGAFVNTERKTK